MLLPAAKMASDWLTGGEESPWWDPFFNNVYIYSINLVLTLSIYGYFAFGIADDGTSCMGPEDENLTHRLTDEPNKGDYEEVGDGFRFGFALLFFNTLLQALILFAIHFWNLLEQLQSLVYVVMATILWSFITWLNLWMFRRTHEGMVCSGEFLEDNESQDGYLVETGRFLYFTYWPFFSIVLAMYIFFLIATVLLLISFGFYLYQGDSPLGILVALRKPSVETVESAGKCVRIFYVSICLLMLCGVIYAT